MQVKVTNIETLTVARGFAAWWVVFYHFREALDLSNKPLLAGFIGSGYLAVDFFFILSGFVVYINYNNWFSSFGTGRYFVFLACRFARVYPLYIFVLILFVLNPVSLLLFSESGEVGDRYNLSYFIASVFMVQNWGVFNYLGWNIPGWSISVEFLSYLTFPFVCYVVKRLGTSVVTFCLVIFTSASAILAVHLAYGYESFGDGIGKTGLVRCAFQFFIGCYVANMFIKTKFSCSGIDFLSIVVFVLVGYFVFHERMTFFVVPFCFAFLIILLVRIDSVFSMPRIFFILGEISYATYLIHFFVKDWVKFLSDDVGFRHFVSYLFIVLATSYALYRFVEVPSRYFIRSKLNEAGA